MPSLSEMLAEKKRKEAEALQKVEEAKKAKESAKKALQHDLPHAVIPTLPAPAIGTEQSLQDTDIQPIKTSMGHGPWVEATSKEITIDTLRGLYWMATKDHIGDKKASRSKLKGWLNSLLLTKDGMRTFLKSLEQFVFS